MLNGFYINNLKKIKSYKESIKKWIKKVIIIIRIEWRMSKV